MPGRHLNLLSYVLTEKLGIWPNVVHLKAAMKGKKQRLFFSFLYLFVAMKLQQSTQGIIGRMTDRLMEAKRKSRNRL